MRQGCRDLLARPKRPLWPPYGQWKQLLCGAAFVYRNAAALLFQPGGAAAHVRAAQAATSTGGAAVWRPLGRQTRPPAFGRRPGALRAPAAPPAGPQRSPPVPGASLAEGELKRVEKSAVHLKENNFHINSALKFPFVMRYNEFTTCGFDRRKSGWARVFIFLHHAIRRRDYETHQSRLHLPNPALSD